MERLSRASPRMQIFWRLFAFFVTIFLSFRRRTIATKNTKRRMLRWDGSLVFASRSGVAATKLRTGATLPR
jgi:hypothetical protein